MHAYLFVADPAYHAVTDAAGRFTIADLPAGTHQLRVWHELVGSSERDVVVPAGGTGRAGDPARAYGTTRRVGSRF
jgi:hypothetical protein